MAMKYDYVTDKIYHDEDWMERIILRGQEGWKLVHVRDHADFSYYIFEKVKADEITLDGRTLLTD